MRFFNQKYKEIPGQEGEKITIKLSAETLISETVDAIIKEDSVITISSARFDQSVLFIRTNLSPDKIEAFAAYLKEKYSLSESYHDKPVPVKFCSGSV